MSMEEGFDVDNMFDALNLSGQWQPSSTFDVNDASLNQILDDVIFSVDDVPAPTILNNNDDFNAALINSIPDTYANDDISNLLSTPLGELPRQSTIEETMENMTLEQSNGSSSLFSLSIPMGSSPVEQKEIDNSILVQQYVQEQTRIQRNAKARKSSSYHQSSSTVGPIDVLSSHSGCQPCTTTGQIQDTFDYSQQILQFDSSDSLKIKLLSQPRPTFRPRTQTESKFVSHYLRCIGNSQFEYPTISIPQIWALQSVKNIIEVTLCTIDKLPHEYTIDNKFCQATYDDEALIFRQNESHTLYFCLTNEDIKNGYKSLMIEYIKSKQDEKITKELIRNRQLEKSLLRFTRIYQSDKNTFQRDENSVEYSNVMTEGYGDIGVEHMGPKVGPMGGNERIYALLKGRFVKEDISVLVREESTGWQQQISITKNGNLIFFVMPAFPFSQVNRAVTNIIIYYKGEELFQSVFIYKGDLDQELANLNLNESTADTNPSSNTFDVLDFFSATGVCPVSHSSRKSSTTKRTTKRLSNKNN